MKQDCQRIEDLIERFFEGQTSNEEEQELYAYFANENLPEHLLSYRPVFAYFGTGMREEESNPQEKRMIRPVGKKKISIWASVAASLLILISFGIYHFTREKEFNPYEGSYIIRNGVKITDPKIVNPEIEKTLYLVQEKEKKQEQLLQNLQEKISKDPYEQALKEIRQRHLGWVDKLEDEALRNEILKMINYEL